MSSAAGPAGGGLGVDDGVRALLLLMPRLVGRAKRLAPPAALQALDLTPRHLSLLALLLSDGPDTVTSLAERLEVATTTVSLVVGDLAKKGVLQRHRDEQDRRRTIVDIADGHRPAVQEWLAPAADAWRTVIEPLTPEQRSLLVEALDAYDREVAAAQGGGPEDGPLHRRGGGRGAGGGAGGGGGRGRGGGAGNRGGA